jgi:GNAT superfamily N-acetyltransferase
MDDILDLSALAQVVGIPILQARNWTSGRPLRIKPSVRAAIGKGSRNLYDKTDVFKVAVAQRLRQHGLNFRLIEYVLDYVDLEGFAKGSSDWLILKITGEGIEHEDIASDTGECGLTTLEYTTGCTHVAIELSSLLGKVVQQIQNYMKAQTSNDE